MTSSLTKTTILISILFPLFSALSQDGGEETAAEASITGSAAQPSIGSSGSIEGNPLVQAVRAGLISLDDAMNLGLGKIRDLSSLGGNFGDLLTSIVAAGDVDLVMVQKLNALGLSKDLLTAALKVAADYDSSSLQNQEALVSAATLAKGFLTDRTITSTESLDSITSINAGDFTKSGYNIALIEILNKYGAIGQKGNSLLDAEFGSSRSLSTALTAESSTAGYLDLLSTLTGGRSLTETVLGSNPAEVDLSKPTASVIDVPMENVSLAPGANITIGATSSSGPDYSGGYAPDSLEGFTWIETEIYEAYGSSVTDVETVTANGGVTKQIHSDPFSETKMTITAPNGDVFTLDIDDDGYVVVTEGGVSESATGIQIDEVGDNQWIAVFDGDTANFDFNTGKGSYDDYEENDAGVAVKVEEDSFEFSFTSSSTSGTPYSYKKTGPNTAEVTLTFSNEENPMPEVSTVKFTSPNEGSFTWVEYTDADMETKSGQGGSGTFVMADSSKRELPVIAGPSTIDVSKYLTKNNDNSVYVIGAAKDMKIVSDVTFKNSNTEEDHALVLGAADDFMISGTESDRIDVTYEGSNLAFGSGGTESDSMYLVNTNITTGGNLAAGTLGTLNITNATINVGNGGANSDPDNIYLYANDLIQINNLDFSNSRLDDVYMEAITVNLKDVDFPAAAQVHLRSKDGSLSFGTYSKPVVGAVNLTEVTHGAINGGQVLADTDFTKTSNGYKSSTNLATGHNAFTISSQSRGD